MALCRFFMLLFLGLAVCCTSGCADQATSADTAKSDDSTARTASENEQENDAESDWESNVIHSVAKVTTSSVDKMPKEEFPWGQITWLMNDKIDPKATMTYGVVRIEAGHSNPLHVHPNCEEYLYVVSGSCEHVLGDKTVTLKQGDVIRIPKYVPHKAKALGDTPMDAVIVYDSPDRKTILLEAGEE